VPLTPVVLLLVAGAVVKEFVLESKLRTLIANGVLLIVMGLIQGLVVIGVFLPLIKLMVTVHTPSERP
jgi:hypothetical protein